MSCFFRRLIHMWSCRLFRMVVIVLHLAEAITCLGQSPLTHFTLYCSRKNIHIPPMEGFLVIPSSSPYLCKFNLLYSYFPLKVWLFRLSSPSEFPNYNPSWGGYGYFPQAHMSKALGFHGNDCFWYHVNWLFLVQWFRNNRNEKPFATDIFSLVDQTSFEKRFFLFSFSRSNFFD